MEQYIPKAAVLAEIERRRESNTKERYFGRLVEDNYFLDFINTIEVKELDLEREIKEVQRNYKTIEEYEGYPCTMYADGIEWIARHFFELGLKSKSSYVGIPNIDDTLKEMGVDPDSKLAKSFKESYFRALDEL